MRHQRLMSQRTAPGRVRLHNGDRDAPEKPTAERPPVCPGYGICPACHTERRLRKDGTIFGHSYCLGAGKFPEDGVA